MYQNFFDMHSSASIGKRINLFYGIYKKIDFKSYSLSKNQKYFYKMKKVYIRRDKDQLQINFHYKNPEFNIDRDFNFSRNVNELVDVFLDRMKNNLEKEFNKKLKKKKSKQTSQIEQQELLVEQKNLPEISVKFCRANEPLKNTSFSQILENIDDLSLTLLQDCYEILYNQPYITTLTLPSTILANYYVYPNKCEMLFAEKENSVAVWYRGKTEKSNVQHIRWEKIHEGFSYLTTNEDIGYLIKFQIIPGNGREYGPSVEVIAKNEIQAGPGRCPFEDRHLFTKEILKSNNFRVVTYNLLADLYADSDYSQKELFPYCPPYALSIDYRKQLFIKEILGYNADVICLQEVDSKIFNFDLLPILSQANFSGIWKKKGNTAEGVAVFFNNNRFDLINIGGINLGENIDKLPEFKCLSNKIEANKPLMERIVVRSTALQVITLRSKETGNYLIIGNTHLYFHPDADHIRLLQIAFSMLHLEAIYNKLIKDLNLNKSQCSILFCGDFNSTPECGIYKLLTEQFVGEDFIDWKSNENEAVKNVSISQPFNFKSACGTPQYTHFTPLFSGCLDYIFYQTDNIEVSEVIPLPTAEELKAHIAIPSVVFPSDHVALITDLKWKN